MLRGLFVTGTDTGVGKTVVSAALMHRYRGITPLKYWKPIQTGVEQDDDTATVQELGGCNPDEIWDRGVRLPGAVAPYLAAEREGLRIDVCELDVFLPQSAADFQWIVEGAGGPLVPINESEFMTDLMQRLGTQVLLVARSGLGTIHHTLSTLEALRRRQLRVAGCVMVGARNEENRKAIERWGDIAVLGELPLFADLSSTALAGWAAAELDRHGILINA